MEKAQVVLLKMKTTPNGVITFWLIGELVSLIGGLFKLENTCKIWEMQKVDSRGRPTPGTVNNILTDVMLTEGFIQVPDSSVELYREIQPGDDLYKTYESGLVEYRAEKAGLLLPKAGSGKNSDVSPIQKQAPSQEVQ